jgi:hypothetical protein
MIVRYGSHNERRPSSWPGSMHPLCVRSRPCSAGLLTGRVDVAVRTAFTADRPTAPVHPDSRFVVKFRLAGGSPLIYQGEPDFSPAKTLARSIGFSPENFANRRSSS